MNRLLINQVSELNVMKLSKFEKSFIKGSEVLYEGAFRYSDLVYQDSKEKILWTLKKEGSILKILIEPVTSVLWELPHKTAGILNRKSHSFVLTNFWLSRSYTEDLSYQVVCEGVPEFKIKISLKKNSPIKFSYTKA